MPSPRARLAAALLIVVALVLASCGGDGGTDETTATTPQDLTAGLSGQERQAAAAIEAYVAAFDSGDPERICPLTSRTDAALERCKDTLPEFHPPHPTPPLMVRSIEVHGSRAKATTGPRSGNGKPVYFQLQRVDGEWKVVVASLQG